MDFDETPAEAQFRSEARSWLAANAAPRSTDSEPILPLFEHADAAQELEWVRACRQWQAVKASGGYAAITWPRELGGRNGTAIQEIIFEQEERRFDVATGAFGITLGMVAPTLIAHGNEVQRAHVPRMLSGDEIWCQLFSEPNAGSDLAAMRTSATRDGDDWLITGQKVWTSGAHYADWGYLIARTDPSVPKHRGLTAFILPMNSPGVDVRPLRQMTGGANFNEVYLDEVRVPDAYRLDDPGSGWRVALTTLMNERFSARGLPPSAFDAVVGLARAQQRSADPVIRQSLARLYTAMQVNQFSVQRALTSISRGATPGPEGSGGKIAHVESLRQISALCMQLAGPNGTLDNEWSQIELGVPGMRIGGGTDEIQLNIIGERVLGLPPEPKVDRSSAFAEGP